VFFPRTLHDAMLRKVSNSLSATVDHQTEAPGAQLAFQHWGGHKFRDHKFSSETKIRHCYWYSKTGA